MIVNRRAWISSLMGASWFAARHQSGAKPTIQNDYPAAG